MISISYCSRETSLTCSAITLCNKLAEGQPAKTREVRSEQRHYKPQKLARPDADILFYAVFFFAGVEGYWLRGE